MLDIVKTDSASTADLLLLQGRSVGIDGESTINLLSLESSLERSRLDLALRNRRQATHVRVAVHMGFSRADDCGLL